MEHKHLPHTNSQLRLMALKESPNKPRKPKLVKQDAIEGDAFITTQDTKTKPKQVGMMALREALTRPLDKPDVMNKPLDNPDMMNKPTYKLNSSFDCHSDSDSGIASNRSSIFSEDIRASITIDDIDGINYDNSNDYKVRNTDYDTSKDSVQSSNNIHIGGGITGIVEVINKLQNDLIQMTSYLDHESKDNPSCEKSNEANKEIFKEEPKKFVTETYLELSPYDIESEDAEHVEMVEDDSDTGLDEDFLLDTCLPAPADEWSPGNIGLKKPVPQAAHPRGAKGAMFSMSFVTNGQLFSANKRK